MKIILVSILFFFILISDSSLLYSQALIGYNYDEVIDKCLDQKLTFTEGQTDSFGKFIQIDQSISKVVYVFNSNNLCYITIIYPKSQLDLKNYVENYNEEYVVVSDTEWKAYLTIGICDIHLDYDSGNYYFLWIFNN